jgi:hypothetical protein
VAGASPTTSPSGDLIPTIRGSGAHPGRGKSGILIRVRADGTEQEVDVFKRPGEWQKTESRGIKGNRQQVVRKADHDDDGRTWWSSMWSDSLYDDDEFGARRIAKVGLCSACASTPRPSQESVLFIKRTASFSSHPCRALPRRPKTNHFHLGTCHLGHLKERKVKSVSRALSQNCSQLISRSQPKHGHAGGMSDAQCRLPTRVASNSVEATQGI